MNKDILDSREYRDYIEHQKKKTTNPDKVKKWLGKEWNKKFNGFKKIFSQYMDIFDATGKVLCLGARTGQEVAALRDLGLKDSIGLDLVSFEPYVIEGDFHDLPFDDNSISLVYTNAVDHVAHKHLWASEIKRVLKRGGYLLMNLRVNEKLDEFSVFQIDDVDSDLISLFEDFYVLRNHAIKTNVHAMNYEVLLKKR